MTLVILGGLVVLVAPGLAAMIAFGTSNPPPVLASISDPFRTVDFSALPPAETLTARDGTVLAYRRWTATPAPGEPERVVIAVHGSSAMGSSMHPLAQALRAAGMTVYAPDIRGHGDSGRRGDIDDASQLDDDLADLVAAVKAKQPNARLTLLGFSSGGGFALRIGATPLGAAFERVVLISPMLGPRAPTTRPDAGGWVKPFIPRIIGLLLLNRLGIHGFDYLPALAFAIAPENAARLTGAYSFRLMRAFGTNDYEADLRNARAPLALLAGSRDEAFVAELYAPTVHAARAEVPVTIVPDLGHIGMTTDPRAAPAIVAAIRG